MLQNVYLFWITTGIMYSKKVIPAGLVHKIVDRSLNQITLHATYNILKRDSGYHWFQKIGEGKTQRHLEIYPTFTCSYIRKIDSFFSIRHLPKTGIMIPCELTCIMNFICFKNKHVLPGVVCVSFLHLRYEDQWYYMNGGLIHRLGPLMGLQYVSNTIKIILEVPENESVSLFSFIMLITCIPITTVYTGKMSSPFYFCPILFRCQRANWRLGDNQNIFFKLLC